MGGWLLFNVEFPNREERDKFEKFTKLKRMFQYWNQKDLHTVGESLWYNCYYYPAWEGYGEAEELIKKCKKKKIKIVKFLSVDLSTNGCWYDELKQEAYNEDSPKNNKGEVKL